MNKIRLVTVTGSRTDTLEYMLNHYYDLVDEIYVVAYDTNNGQHANVKAITDKFKQKVFLYKHEDEQEYNWETVTAIYNEIKNLHPNDWWVVSDDDEFHVYPKPLQEIISDCELNGWDIVRGGFIDRIGKGGTFEEIKEDVNIFEQFPLNTQCIYIGLVDNKTFGKPNSKMYQETVIKFGQSNILNERISGRLSASDLTIVGFVSQLKICSVPYDIGKYRIFII